MTDRTDGVTTWLQCAVPAVVGGRDAVTIRRTGASAVGAMFHLELEDGAQVVAKCAPVQHRNVLQEEADGIAAIAATKTVLTPQVFGVVVDDCHAALLMSRIEAASASPSHDDWARFGKELAQLHHADVGRRYGFSFDNHCGATPQPNAWHDDWVEFNRTCRLGYQCERARQHGALSANDAQRIEALMNRLDDCIPPDPKPALLHGDLWSGNAMPTNDGRIAVIDPAPSVGDGWADIAMMQLFGGFPESCMHAYAEHVDPIDPRDRDRRLACYQLYHLLNHVNLFGSGYIAQTMDRVRQLGF